MSKPEPTAPDAAADEKQQEGPASQEPGTNAVEHEPDPSAEQKDDGETRHIRRSPYTAGNY